MAVLARCWLIIEATIIPNGFLKWFYLSFYIHPFLLFVCQIFLWLKSILKYLILIFFYPCQIVSAVCIYVFRFFRKSFTRLTNTASSKPATEFGIDENSQLEKIPSENQNLTCYYSSSSLAPISCQVKAFQFQEKIRFEEENFKFQADHDQVLCDSGKLEDKSMDIDDDNLSSIWSSCESSSSDSCKEDQDSLSSSKENKVNDHHEYISSSTCSFSISAEVDKLDMANILRPEDDQDSNEYSTPSSPPGCLNPGALVEQRQETNHHIGIKDHDHEKDLDMFYNKYIERMKWFDKLNYDRTSGINEILNKQIRTPISAENNPEAVDLLVSPSRKKLLRSLERDFELVYVAQACLSWEVLYHQYRKVEALSSSITSENIVFYDNEAGNFQKFQVLLERFMEEERCEGKRVWNYVRGRFSLKSLLQVPKVSGYFVLDMEETENELINVKEVLKAIERCVEAFSVLVKTDDKKPWWKFTSSLWTVAPVEDPRDLKLLADLTRQLQKKELWLKDSKGKQRCWFRKVMNPVDQSERKEMMFTMIDIKMVARVLQLPLLSSSQLKWCQQKLDSIDFEEGKLARARTSGPLFPA